MNKELYLNGINGSNACAIIDKIQAPENLCVKKISFAYFKKGIVSATFDFLPKSELEILLIFNSTICSDDAVAIADFIRGSKLLTLDLSRCTFEVGTLLTIMGSIKESLLQKIVLDKCAIGMNEARVIVDATMLPHVPMLPHVHVIKLAFTRCSFREGALPLILNAVKESTLQTLVLKWTKFSNAGTIAIADYVADANDTLTKLSLVGTISDNPLAITTAIHNCSLRIVDVRQTSFFNNAADVMKLIEHAHIEKFDFDKSCFNVEEIVAIMDAIKRNPSFKHISFADVTMSDYMFGKMCDLLENSSLTSLYGCDLDWAQLRELVISIKKSSITSLGLQSDVARGWHILDIHDLLKCYNLTKLDLRLAGITDEMIKDMLPLIKDSSLIKFNSTCRIKSSTKAELEQILAEQRKRSNRYGRIKSANN